MGKQTIHRLRVLSKEEVMVNRSSAYEFIDFDKQETIEEASQIEGTHRASQHNMNRAEAGYNAKWFKRGAIFGAKWQQERMYSEEEVEDLIYKVCGTVARLQGITLNGNHIDTAYKQFKKK